MTGREDDAGRALRSLLLEETNAMPVDTHHAAVHLRRRLDETRRRRRVTLAVAASVVVVAITLAGGWIGINKAGEPARTRDQSVAVAREFVATVGRYDADAAISYLANDATVQGDLIAYAGSGDAENLRLTLAHYRAAHYEQTVTDCVHVDTSPAWVSVRCAFDLQAVRSDEIGLGTYTGNYWRLIVRDGKIVSAQQTIALNSTRFSHQVWGPFASWVDINHPDDLSTMFVDAEKIVQRLTEDSNRLWEQRSAEYVAVVKQNPAAHLDEPEVAAYVAELDSICAAAQTKVKNEIKAVPQQNQPALREVRERVMREAILQLQVAPLPKAVHWPYRGRAFPLLEKYYTYPQDVQPPESLARQIRQSPGLDKCILPV